MREVNNGLLHEIGADSDAGPWRRVVTPGGFTGQTVAVTGAFSGFRRATASRTTREGGRVIAFDVSRESLAKVVPSLPAEPVRFT